MSSSDNNHNSYIVATDEAVALVVVPNPATDNTEAPANVAPDVARTPSNTNIPFFAPPPLMGGMVLANPFFWGLFSYTWEM